MLAVACSLLLLGCVRPSPQPVWPSDPKPTAPDTNSVNALVVATNLSVGIVITFSGDMTAELQAALTAAGMQVVGPRVVIIETVDGTEWQREWIAAALAAGGEASPYVKSEIRNPKSEGTPKSEVRSPKSEVRGSRFNGSRFDGSSFDGSRFDGSRFDVS